MKRESLGRPRQRSANLYITNIYLEYVNSYTCSYIRLKHFELRKCIFFSLKHFFFFLYFQRLDTFSPDLLVPGEQTRNMTQQRESTKICSFITTTLMKSERELRKNRLYFMKIVFNIFFYLFYFPILFISSHNQ